MSAPPHLSPFARLFALISAVLDPICGLLASMPNRIVGLGDTSRWNTPRRRRRGLVVILGGIEGPSIYQRCMAAGLLRGRWRGAVVVYPWNRGIPFIRELVNLMNRARNEVESDRVVELIRDYQREYPGRPAGILAQSGGCWIATRTLEKLRDSERVRSVVLLAPCISPYHDFSNAAAHCERGFVVVRAAGDAFFLGLGTSLLGTSDRRWGPAGAWLGWSNVPTGMIDLVWRPAWIRLRYYGNHTSSASPRFVASVIVPFFT